MCAGGSLFLYRYSDNVFNCIIQLKLVGQLTFRNGMPSGIEQKDCATVACSGSTSVNEFDNRLMLITLATWVKTHYSDLSTIYNGDIDDVILLSGLDFASSTVGYAGVGTLCRSTSTAGLSLCV